MRRVLKDTRSPHEERMLRSQAMVEFLSTTDASVVFVFREIKYDAKK